MRTYSTSQAARMIGVHKITLVGWLLDGKVKEPRRVSHAGQVIRIWTNRDIERVMKYKKENYRKGRGRKPKQKK